MTHAKPPAKSAHHLVKFLYQELQVEGISLREFSEKSGIAYNTLRDAFTGTNISLFKMEDALNVLGYTTKPTRLSKDDPRWKSVQQLRSKKATQAIRSV